MNTFAYRADGKFLKTNLWIEKKNNIWVENYEQISIQLILKRKVKTLSALTRLLNKDEGTFFLHVDFSNYYSILHTYKPPFSRVLQTSSWFTKKVILTVYLWGKKSSSLGTKRMLLEAVTIPTQNIISWWLSSKCAYDFMAVLTKDWHGKSERVLNFLSYCLCSD